MKEIDGFAAVSVYNGNVSAFSQMQGGEKLIQRIGTQIDVKCSEGDTVYGVEGACIHIAAGKTQHFVVGSDAPVALVGGGEDVELPQVLSLGGR